MNRLPRVIARVAAATGAAMLLGMAVGCVMTPDRQAEADRVKAEVSRMPGVEQVTMIYSNDITRGTRFDLSLTMRTATQDQITAVAHRINELVGDDFDGYKRSADFTVAPQAELEIGESGSDLDADWIADGTRRLRQLRDLIPEGELELFSGRDTVTARLFDVPSADEAITATRTALGDLPITVDIYPDRDGQRQDPRWKITFPFTPVQEATIRHQIGVQGLRFGEFTINDGHLAEVSVPWLRHATAYEDLKRLIVSISPTPAHPLMLDFGSNSGLSQPELLFGGSVDVGACDYPSTLSEKNPEKYYTPESIALQTTLRAEFDTCPK